MWLYETDLTVLIQDSERIVFGFENDANCLRADNTMLTEHMSQAS
jgi:hypothetical protein